MATWEDFERRLEEAITLLPQQAEAALNDSADILVMQLESNVPVGEVGETRFLHDAMTTRGEVQQMGSATTVGVAPERLLGNPSDSPPPNTIRDFLEWWRSSGQGKLRPRSDEPTMGAAPLFHPWWSLSREQKEELEAQRALGRFGGRPPVALYWYVQDEGSSSARVMPQQFVTRSWEGALPHIRARIHQIRLF